MSSSFLPRLHEERDNSSSFPPLGNENKGQSRLKQPTERIALKFPRLDKPQTLPKCTNQDEEEKRRFGRQTKQDGSVEKLKQDDDASFSIKFSSTCSCPSLNDKRPAKDKNRDLIKALEEKKRQEKRNKAREDKRKKKLHEKKTQKLLQDANARQQLAIISPKVDDLLSEISRQDEQQEGHAVDGDGDVDATEKRLEQAKKQKRLLSKQRANLARLQAKQREEQEQLELKREREQRKREKVTQTILLQIQDSMNRLGQEQNTLEIKATSSVSNLSEQLPATELTEEMKLRVREQQEVLRRKQQQYLQELANQRRQKEEHEKEATLLKEKRKKRTQKQAQQRLQQAAAKQQAVAEAKERAEAAAAAAAAAEKADNPEPPVDVEAMVARLSKLKERDTQIIPEARDFAAWKKRHGVAPDQKVFCITGWYPVIREELEKRGWFYNEEKLSPYFDFKWTLKSDELKAFKLAKHQYVNHFLQNVAITTKVGLIRNLRSAVWHHSIDIDAMFPRAYDLNDAVSMDKFVQDFRYGVAEGFLKQLASRGMQAQVPGVEGKFEANEALVDVVFDIAKKKIQSKRPDCSGGEEVLEESVDDPLSTGVDELVTCLQWEVLTNCSLDQPGHLRASLVYKKKVYAEDKDSGVDKEEFDMISAQEKKRQRKRHVDAFNREKARLNDLIARVSPVQEQTFALAIRLTKELEALCPQFHINGGANFLLAEPPSAAALTGTTTSQNAWIVKPAGMSRGRGIRVFNDLEELLGYVNVENHKECQWVTQKYIENPLLLCKRKFDIRQWVLVTAWDPLTIWFKDDCYLRFSSEEYSMTDLSDQYVHLTNNSIQKYSDRFNDVYGTDDGEMQVEGNMWHSEDFKTFLSTKMKRAEIWDAQIQPRMKEIVIQSLQCVQDMVQHRSNTCELYGYDFMIDENLTPWLIEVNSSPACDYSTSIARQYVESGLAGIIKVVVDYREYELHKRNGGIGLLDKPETGCWQCIHKAEYIGKPLSSHAVEFQVQGFKIRRKRQGVKPSRKTMTTSPSGKSSSSFVTTMSEINGLVADGNDKLDQEMQDEKQEEEEETKEEAMGGEGGEKEKRDQDVDPLL